MIAMCVSKTLSAAAAARSQNITLLPMIGRRA